MRKEYFTAYCGRGPYEREYLQYSRVWHCIDIVDRFAIDVASVLVLGTATGQVLAHFDEVWGIRPYGCEISRWAHQRIASRYRRRIQRADMRRYVPVLVRRRRTFDLIFCNALMYLHRDDVGPLLAQCSLLTGHFHYWGSTLEDHEAQDAYRTILEPKAWWAKRFREAGFVRTRSPYLWRSTLPGRLAKRPFHG